MRTFALAALLLVAPISGYAAAAAENLNKARCFPTLFKPERGHKKLTFTQLTKEVVITIYTMAGEKIRSLRKFDDTDTLVWEPLINEKGIALASGVYYYTITSPDHPVTRGKFMIVK